MSRSVNAVAALPFGNSGFAALYTRLEYAALYTRLEFGSVGHKRTPAFNGFESLLLTIVDAARANWRFEAIDFI